MNVAPVVHEEAAFGQRDETVRSGHFHPKIDVGRLGQREDRLLEIVQEVWGQQQLNRDRAAPAGQKDTQLADPVGCEPAAIDSLGIRPFIHSEVRSQNHAAFIRLRSTNGRMPPFLKYSISSSVSMRQTSEASWMPLARMMRRVTSMRGFRPAAMPTMSNTSLPSRLRVLRVMSPLNCSGSTPMPTRLERWMRSKLSAITALMPSSTVPLAAQSREEPVPYSLPANTTSGTPCFWYFIEAS